MSKLMLIGGVLGLFLAFLGKAGPGVYDYYLLKDLADRVVLDYANLPINEVMRRVNFELDRSNVKTSKETFLLRETKHGYQVVVTQRIPLSLDIGGRTWAVPGHEEMVLHYESGK
ncbi:MAG: hypothetical protein HQL84_10345 [Magnetococcales bacterium]|nr:hypothetical protein [Magnetococcales bacterium]MBF0150432.1 hypothetical protein [Magnetococcales bacterium]MBF0346796.1 hypothetical protein [Magnetococcales bacterium]MBF0630940.1 hypothetical protein [Magnetococcales bacterium]